MSQPNQQEQTPDPEIKLSRREELSRQIKELIILSSGEGARKGYLAAIDQGIISLSNFLATLILARYVSPTELGVYTVGFIILRLTRVIQDGSIIQPLNTFGATMNIARFRRYFTSTALLQLTMALLLSTISAVLGWILIETGNDTLGPTIFVLWAPISAWQLQEFIRRSLYTRGDVFNATINTSISDLVRMGLLIYWAIEGNLSGTAGLYAIAIGSFVALLPGMWQTRAYWSRNFYNLLLTWNHNWRFGSWITGGNILNWVSVEFYPVLAAGIVSFAAAGAYRALQTLVSPIHMLLRAIDTYLTPRAARDYKESGLPALSRTLRLTYFVVGLPSLALIITTILFPKPILQLLYGDRYLEFSSGIILMAIVYTLLYVNWPIQIVLKAARFSQPIFIANLVATIFTFTLGIWVIYQWGVYGTIAGQALNALIVTIILGGAWIRFLRK